MSERPSEHPELADVLARAADPDAFDAWQQRAKTTGWCRNPVRLIGAAQRIDTTTGQIVGRFASTDLPDRVLLKACGHRRATRCPTCSATYQADAYQLVAAGLRGGKGIPDTIATHPIVFVTLTAPSFGPVHTRHHTDTGLTSPCHPEAGTCPHGRANSCPAVHQPGDPLLGQPVCPDCFDYPAAVLWNAHAGELWRRTTIATHRSMATLAGMPRSQLRQQVRISFSKVVEYQRRGSVHIHAVIRLDAAIDLTERPTSLFDAALLSAAVTRAVRTTTAPCPTTKGVSRPIRWGTQLDLKPISEGGAVSKAVAGYLAKYATKSTDPGGLLDHQLKEADLDHLDQQLTPHLARMVRTAWVLTIREFPSWGLGTIR